MTEFLLTAPASGTGKTTLMTAVLTLLRREGRETAAFKCGPDYIDPMYHRAAEGVHSYNLDLFLNDASTVRRIYSRYTKYCDAAVVEGVMGHYDGVGGSTDRASSWHLADTLGLPCVLTIEGTQHKIAETIVQNTKKKDQKVLTMDSMQATTSDDVKAGTTYLSVMENNLNVLNEALN